MTRCPAVWLLQEGEPLPVDDHPRLMRTGDQARKLGVDGYEVTWWTSRFNHSLKQFRTWPDVWCAIEPGYRIVLLDGPGYPRNMSWQRMRHYRAIASHFSRLADALPPPALILGSYPSPELCDAGRRYARRHGVPFVVDIRDPWPDMFADYLPPAVQWTLLPVLWYYRRMIRAIARDADGIVAVSQAMLEWGVRYAGRTRQPRDRVFHIGFHRLSQNRDILVPSRFTEADPLICLFATTCGKSYDGETLIDAARLLESGGERRIRFVVSGDGDRRSAWLARAAGLRSLHFTGWLPHEDLLGHFQRAHLGLVLMKGGIARFWLGNKIFEYLSAHLGLVNNVAGEPADIVSSRDLGVNIHQGEASALANALRALVEEPDRVLRYMRNAKRSFTREFDREVVERRYTEYLAPLIQRGVHKGAEALT